MFDDDFGESEDGTVVEVHPIVPIHGRTQRKHHTTVTQLTVFYLMIRPSHNLILFFHLYI